jgi:hypothetical protein
VQQSALVEGDPLLAPIEGADSRELNGVLVDTIAAGGARIQRVVYPPGYRWSTHVKPAVGTDLCMHAHVGFLARGRMEGEYEDGCRFELEAPAAVVVEPGHDAWVVGDEGAVFIGVDFEGATAERFGLPAQHRH